MAKEWGEYQNINDVIDKLNNTVKMQIPEEKYSVPDVYAKPIQFYFLLKKAYDENEYTGWDVRVFRGLITLLALKEYLDLPLEWEDVDLETNNNIFNGALQYAPNRNIFDNDETKWDGKKFCVLKWNLEGAESVDLFIYSPITLIYPVADLREAFSGIPDVKWYDYERGSFLGPEKVLSGFEKKLVFYWLDNILKDFSNNSNEYADTVIDHLKKYQKDLETNIADSEKECFKAKSFNEGRLSKIEALNWLTKTVDVEIDFGEKICYAEIFSQQLIYFNTGAAEIPFAACDIVEKMEINGIGDVYALFPLGEKIQNYVKEYNLADNIEMKWMKKENAEFIEVNLYIGGKNNLYVAKEYKVVKDEDIEKLKHKNIAVPYGDGEIPLIAVWPGTICNQWKKYYIMLNDKGVNGWLEIGGVEKGKGNNSYAVETGYVPYRIPMVKNYGGKRYSVGCIIPKIFSDANGNEKECHATVAVDFGTSSTKVFAKIQGSEEEKEIQIMEDRPLIITCCDNMEKQLLRDYFISDAEKRKNLFSIYRKFKKENLSEVNVVLDGIIYQLHEKEKLENDSMLITDLKWSTEVKKEYYKAFIKQLCFHICILLYEKYRVNKIEWRYALPESLDGNEVKIITGIWEENVKKYLNEVSETKHETVKYITESEAASRFFLFGKRADVNAEKGYLVVDIGGGSTDIALWQGKDDLQMKWHTSVKVAGRKMFIRWLSAYIDNFEKKLPEAEDIISYMISEEAEPVNRDSLVERILDLYYEKFNDVYICACNESNSNKWILKLRSKIIQALTMFMFALGYQIGALLENKKFSIPEGNGSFVIALAGKGATIFEWTGCNNNNEKWKKVFKAGIKAAGVDAENLPAINIRMNKEELKTEVVKGLLVKEDGFKEMSDPNKGEAEISRENQIESFNAEDILEKLANAYIEIFLKEEKELEPLKFENESIINHLKNLEDRGIMQIFMEIIYEQYISDEEQGG